MSETLNNLLALAQSQIGYTEKDSDKDLDTMVGSSAGVGNHTKYARDLTAMGLPGYCGLAWCAVYQMWLEVRTVGKDQALLNMGPQFYSCFAVRDYARSQGRWLPFGSTPRPGDLVIFRQSHIARITGVTAKKITTNEGNTTNATAVVRNGGMVCSKSYAIDHAGILGYVKMDYGEKTQPEGWAEDDKGCKYRHENGSYTANAWELIDGNWYWFDGAGYAVHDDWKLDKSGHWYYLGRDCAMVKGKVILVGEEAFALDMDGTLVTEVTGLAINGRGAITVSSPTHT